MASRILSRCSGRLSSSKASSGASMSMYSPVYISRGPGKGHGHALGVPADALQDLRPIPEPLGSCREGGHIYRGPLAGGVEGLSCLGGGAGSGPGALPPWGGLCRGRRFRGGSRRNGFFPRRGAPGAPPARPLGLAPLVGGRGAATRQGAPFSKASKRRRRASGVVSSSGLHSRTKAISSSARWLA